MLEIAEVLRQAGPEYRRLHGEAMLPSQHKVMRDLIACRTPALGGQVRACDHCGETRFSYHSCRNRHCPKCQGEQTERWLESHRSHQLDCSHFLLTFTLPEELRSLAQSHQRLVYGALLRAAAESVLQLADDPHFLGATPGILAVLHTWTRDLRYHPHVHLLVTGGGLSECGEVWRQPQHSTFLLPGRVLSVLFRAKIRDALERDGLTTHTPRQVWRRRWVVHAQYAGAGDAVLEYLSRYVHRVALPNSRIEAIEPDFVTFRYREQRTGELRRCTLAPLEFLRRFLQHTLPRGFVKVRSYGIRASSRRNDLAAAVELLAARRLQEGLHPKSVPQAEAEPESTVDPDPLCPTCGKGRMRIVGSLEPVEHQEVLACARDPPSAAENPRTQYSTSGH